MLCERRDYWLTSLIATISALVAVAVFVLTPSLATADMSVQITAPSSASKYWTKLSTVSVSGMTTGNVTAVRWQSGGANGICSGTTTWQVANISLVDGDNTITITAEDDSTSPVTTASATIVVARDRVEPSLSIASPTSGPEYSSRDSTLTMSGSAADNLGVAAVMWSNSRGGSGACTGTTSWVVSDITLQSGDNQITVTAYDSAGNLMSQTLNVVLDLTPPAINILKPTAGVSYTCFTDTIDISGVATDNKHLASVECSNNRVPGTILCNGTGAWSVTGLPVLVGDPNVITVTAYDDAGNSTSDTLNITVPDTRPPSVTIISPVAGGDGLIVADYSVLTVSGTAADNLELASVSWSNNRGGTGVCVGTYTWTTSNIPLKNGTNRVTILVRDTSGNTASASITVQYVDDVVPAVIITTPTSEAEWSTTSVKVNVSGTASDDTQLALVTWSNNQGGKGSCAGLSTWTASGVALKPGSNQITITATDTVGNSAFAVIVITFTDTTAPSVIITKPNTTSFPTHNNTLDIAGTASDDVSVVEVSWSKSTGERGICTGKAAWTCNGIPLSLGANTITVSAKDDAGNIGSTGISVDYSDIAGPTVTIKKPTENLTYTTKLTSVTLEGIAVDATAVASVKWVNSRGGGGDCEGNDSWSVLDVPLEQGDNVITITARDSSANIGTDTLTVIVPDTTSPTLLITAPTADTTYATNKPKVDLVGTASDNIGVVSVAWVNSRGGTGTCGGTTSWSAGPIGLLLGENAITVTAKDAAGNKVQRTLTITFTDITPPAVIIRAPTANPTYSAISPAVTIEGVASDDVAIKDVTWVTDTGASGTASGSITWVAKDIPLKVGVNNIRITAMDTSSNAGTDLIIVTLVDTPPYIDIVTPTKASDYTSTASPLAIGGTASDAVGLAAVTWLSDRGGSGTCIGTAKWNVPAITLAPGDNTITVTARDMSGNTAVDSIVVTLNDTNAPVLTITEPTKNPEYSTSVGSVSLAGTAKDNVGLAVVRWSIDGGANGICVGTASWAAAELPLVKGVNTITVTATDTSGNSGEKKLKVTFTPPDVTPPSIVIEKPTAEGSYSTETTPLAISGSASDDVSVKQVTWSTDTGQKGAATGTTTWSIAKIILNLGVNNIIVKVDDASGNSSTDTLQVTLIDLKLPTIKITSPASTPTYKTATGAITIGGSATDNMAVTEVTYVNNRGGSGRCVGTAAWKSPSITLSDGDNLITATARDASGNSADVVIKVTYTKPDITKPTVTITVPTIEASYSTSAATVDMEGEAVDDTGVAAITWVTSRGAKGTCTGTNTWSLKGLKIEIGSTVVTVTAKDATGNAASATLKIIRVKSDGGPPSITLTEPISTGTFTTKLSSVKVVGTALDDVGVTSVSWVNNRGGSGVCTGTTSWSVDGISLYDGDNTITVTASDAASNKTSTSINVTYTKDDTSLPSVTIILPTVDPVCRWVGDKVTISGTSAGSKTIVQITYASSTGITGTCMGTDAWTTEAIPVSTGDNAIMFTATDSDGRTATAQILLTRVEAAPGDAWLGLCMVSVPLVPSATDPKPQVGFKDAAWMTFDPVGYSYILYPDPMTWFDPQSATPGRGFWSLFDGTPTSISGLLLPVDKPAEIHILPGWNLIGHPFVEAVKWRLDTIKVKDPTDSAGAEIPLREASGLVDPYCWGWQQNADNPLTGSYYIVYDSTDAIVDRDILEPWRGYWIKAGYECYLIVPPPGEP